MRELRVYAAQPIRGDASPTLVVRIEEQIPEVDSPQDAYEQFLADGNNLAEALWNVLPGGTVDKLLAALLTRKASQFRVPFGGDRS